MDRLLLLKFSPCQIAVSLRVGELAAKKEDGEPEIENKNQIVDCNDSHSNKHLHVLEYKLLVHAALKRAISRIKSEIDAWSCCVTLLFCMAWTFFDAGACVAFGLLSGWSIAGVFAMTLLTNSWVLAILRKKELRQMIALMSHPNEWKHWENMEGILKELAKNRKL